jgi:hypothetical protein
MVGRQGRQPGTDGKRHVSAGCRQTASVPPSTPPIRVLGIRLGAACRRALQAADTEAAGVQGAWGAGVGVEQSQQGVFAGLARQQPDAEHSWHTLRRGIAGAGQLQGCPGRGGG